MDKDNLIVCDKCGSTACYENPVNKDTTTWMCFGCGFTTSTTMTEDSQLVKDTIETSPTLYKDIMFKDKNGRVWFPATITLPGKGMTFADGNNKKNWEWSAVLATPVEEKEKKKFPKGQTHKMDMVNMKKFNRERGFMDALEHIGFFKINFTNED